MSTVFFFRHGQAGSRIDYDRLSDLGHEQARTLGDFLASDEARFDRLFVGGLRRQRETLDNVLARCPGLPTPETDPRWSEFDLDAVFAEIAPRLCQDDPDFRAQWLEIERQVEAGSHGVHRDWLPADTTVVRTWVQGRYETECESWQHFVARVRQAGQELAALPPGSRTAVFTSATPVSIWVTAALGTNDPRQAMKLAGTSLNTNISAIHFDHGEPHLALYNSTPHLRHSRLRTYR